MDFPQFFRAYAKYLYAGIAVVLAVYVFLSAPPGSFPVGTIVSVQSGRSLSQVTNDMYAAHIVRSPLIFRSAIILLGGEKKVIAGDYLLDKREISPTLALRLVKGDFRLAPVKVTIPEGWNAMQISGYIHQKLPHIAIADILSLAKKNEGYLFPDTYFISPIATADTVVRTMRANFDTTFESLSQSDSGATPRSKKDVIIMASIVEAEASTTEDRRVVAGILWHRLDIGMPLQVDSTFSYINGKASADLTMADLKIDSPYNTYIHTGLPPTPINNPGRDSLEAVLNPETSNYLYFLSGKDGQMHYAHTFDEHKSNKATYGISG